METIGIPELAIILVIVILLFGIGRIGKIGGELGSGIRAFREGLRGDEPPQDQENAAAENPPLDNGSSESEPPVDNPDEGDLKTDLEDQDIGPTGN